MTVDGDASSDRREQDEDDEEGRAVIIEVVLISMKTFLVQMHWK
jgi:hypothetical protein